MIERELPRSFAALPKTAIAAHGAPIRPRSLRERMQDATPELSTLPSRTIVSPRSRETIRHAPKTTARTSLPVNATLALILLSAAVLGANLVFFGTLDSPLSPAAIRQRQLLVYGGLGGILLLGLTTPDSIAGRKRSRNSLLITVWMLFATCLLASAIGRADLGDIPERLILLIGLPILYFEALPRLAQGQIARVAPLALALGSAPYCLWSILTEPPTFGQSYQGLLSNSNCFGQLGVQTIVGATAAIVTAEHGWRPSIFLARGAAALGWVAIIASCSMASFAAALAATLALVPISLSTLSRFMKWAMLLGLAGVIVLAAGVDASSWGRLLEGLADKSARKSDQGDMLNGRTDIWMFAWETRTWFGHGHDLFDSRFGLGAHNAVFSALGEDGIVAAVGIVTLFGVCGVWSFTRGRRSGVSGRVATAMLLAFIIIAMAETPFATIGSGTTICFYCGLSIAISLPSGPGLKSPRPRSGSASLNLAENSR